LVSVSGALHFFLLFLHSVGTDIKIKMGMGMGIGIEVDIQHGWVGMDGSDGLVWFGYN